MEERCRTSVNPVSTPVCSNKRWLVVCSLLPSSLIWDCGLDLHQTRTMQQTYRGTAVCVFATLAGMFARSFGLQIAALGHWTE